ncbi:MFS transporter [Mesorhizobium sp. BAC0120]|uniref:MFS transporter n=1 Tax=Mesorhizobium sp. BAC0120 TaxID=3090670 RepID=UPI00298C0962|nr:MFS transporter [Mesorhizobium sp. BAC0120]MDW6025514.1 MFS transporter [Mesorhizobium sp. BAC0120]
MTSNASRLAIIVVLQIVGILAGAQLGKIAPLVDWYQREVGLSLTLIGWFTSMIGIFVAAVALPAGWAIERAGPDRTFVAGSLVLAAGGFALSLLDAPSAVLAARLVEGAGYLVLVIATPALLAAISPARWKAPVLAIWGGFVPIGFAVADFSARAMLPETGPKIYLATSIAAFAVVAGLAALLLHEEKYLEQRASGAAGNTFMATMTLPVWLTALAFGVYVVSSVGFFTFMPAYAGERDGLLLSAGAIALAVPVGNILAGILVRGRGLRFIVLLSGAGFLANMALAVPGFTAADPAFATLAVVAYAIIGGLVASALFAAIPFLVPQSGSASVAIGLVAQAGGLGTLFGPPLAGHIIENFGFGGFGMLLAAVSLIGVVVLLPLTLAKVQRDNLLQTQQ